MQAETRYSETGFSKEEFKMGTYYPLMSFLDKKRASLPQTETRIAMLF